MNCVGYRPQFINSRHLKFEDKSERILCANCEKFSRSVGRHVARPDLSLYLQGGFILLHTKEVGFQFECFRT